MDTRIIGSSTPVRNVRVRRRRGEEGAVLIFANHYWVLDAFSDVLWRRCTGKATVAEIIRAMAEELGSSEDLVTNTLLILGRFEDAGLLAVSDGAN